MNRDYLTALHQRFELTSERAETLKGEIETARNALHEVLETGQKKLLLRMTDLADDLRDEVALNGFISGFRLAMGINRELGELGPFSYDEEQEEQARRAFAEEISE